MNTSSHIESPVKASGRVLAPHRVSSRPPASAKGDIVANLPIPASGVLVTRFLVSADVERSARFYRDVLGGETVRTWEPSSVALANSWDVSVSSDGRDLYVPDATNSQIASFSIGARAQLKPAGHPQLLPAGSAGIAAS